MEETMAESLLKSDVERFPNRELPIALAHELARAKVTDQDRQLVLGRIFRRLKPVDQFRCRAELMNCRQAKRGELVAQLAQ
jgi:hypothetical protein